MQCRSSGGSARNSGGAGNAFVLAVSGHAGGVLMREGKGFRFNAAHPVMRPLDGALFSSVAEAEAAAAQITIGRFGVDQGSAHFSALF